MTNILYKGLIGKEDVYWDDTGQGTFSRRASLGTVTMTKIFDPRKAVRTAEYYGAKDDNGVTDCTASLQSALDAGGQVMLTAPNGGYYKITDNLIAQVAGTKLVTFNNAEIRQATANKGGIAITASNIELYGPKITGPQYAAKRDAERGIYVYGSSWANKLTGIKIIRPIISQWTSGIEMEYVSQFTIDNPIISNIYYAGIIGYSVTNGWVLFPDVQNVIGTPLAYGISFTRDEVDSLVTNPVSSDIRIVVPYVSGVENWNGIDTHGGTRIIIVEPTVLNTFNGINLSGAQGASAAIVGPKECSILGGVVDSQQSDGSRGYGIMLTGANGTVGSPVDVATNLRVQGTIVKGFGNDGTYDSAIYCRDTRGTKILGVTVQEAARSAINLYHDNYDFQVVGGSMIDSWGAANSVGVNITDDYNNGYIDGVSFTKGTKTAASTCARAISVANKANNFVRIGTNYNEYLTYVFDSGTSNMITKEAKYQPVHITQNTADTLTVTQMANGIITVTHTTGGTLTLTLPTGEALDDALLWGISESFDWTVINLSAAAADTVTIAANTDHTITGVAEVQSAHSTTGGLYGNAATFRTRKYAADTYVTYRIN